MVLRVLKAVIVFGERLFFPFFKCMGVKQYYVGSWKNQGLELNRYVAARVCCCLRKRDRKSYSWARDLCGVNIGMD